MKWNSIETPPTPESGIDYCLVYVPPLEGNLYSPHGIFTAMWDYDGFFTMSSQHCDCEGERISGITHWTEWPELPKD